MDNSKTLYKNMVDSKVDQRNDPEVTKDENDQDWEDQEEGEEEGEGEEEESE
jgi:hypothetical protein